MAQCLASHEIVVDEWTMIVPSRPRRANESLEEYTKYCCVATLMVDDAAHKT